MNIALESVVQVVDRHVARARGRKLGSIDADTPLFQQGLIDSFGLAELLIELEKLAGEPIPEGALVPDDFESPRVLHHRLQEVS